MTLKVERPVTQILRSRQYSRLNISVTAQDSDVFSTEDEQEFVCDCDLSNSAISNDLNDP